jgi:hypothetical protein
MVAQYTIDLDSISARPDAFVQEVWLAMRVLPSSALKFSGSGEAVPVRFPAGGVGLMLVFDSEAAARAHFGPDVELVSMKRWMP